MNTWPQNWDMLVQGIGCEMCEAGRPESDSYGLRIWKAEHTDAYLQRADIQRGYTIVIWRGRHIVEPTELEADEACAYWSDVLAVARGLIAYYRPLKMNYDTLGNSLPHLHTHLIPRFVTDPAPGRPFPLLPQNGNEQRMPERRLISEAAALRGILAG